MNSAVYFFMGCAVQDLRSILLFLHSYLSRPGTKCRISYTNLWAWFSTIALTLVISALWHWTAYSWLVLHTDEHRKDGNKHQKSWRCTLNPPSFLNGVCHGKMKKKKKTQQLSWKLGSPNYRNSSTLSCTNFVHNFSRDPSTGRQLPILPIP